MKYRSVDQLRPEHKGHRVTVRRKLPEGGYSDVIGVCEQVEAFTVTVRNRSGDLVVIDRSEIVAARVVEALPPKDPANPASG